MNWRRSYVFQKGITYMVSNELQESWKRMCFKDNKVWVRTSEDGSLKVEKGKVQIKYNLEQDYEYNVKVENLFPEEQAVSAENKCQFSGRQNLKTSIARNCDDISKTEDKEDLPQNCIKIYTDGASSGNPGPSGIGIVLIYGDKKKEISSFIGSATNNIAELSAIKTGLTQLKRFDLPVRIFTDSTYAQGVLAKGWKAKANEELVAEIKQIMKKFKDISLIKVRGHSGIKENELADFLATSAIKKA